MGDFLGNENPSLGNGRWDRDVLSRRAYKFNEVIGYSLDEKIKITNDIIAQAKRDIDGDIAVACSFGKDSVVMLHLILEKIPDAKIVFNNTGVEYIETMVLMKKIIKLWDLDVIELKPKPEHQYFRLIRIYGFPGTSRAKQRGGHTPKCCFYLKEKPMMDYVKIKEHGISGIAVGLMGIESVNRRSIALRYGGLHYTVQPWNCYKIWPIIHWTDDDIWKYHDIFEIPRNEAYKKYGITRTGCATCTNFIDWEMVMKKWNPKMYARIRKMMDDFEEEDKPSNSLERWI